MFDSIKKLFGIQPVDYKDLVANGAKIMDVRTKAEFNGGHIKKAVCVPLDQVQNAMKKYKKDDVIITCCQSGARSGAARRMLKANGYQNVYNGGAWTSLSRKIQ